MAELEVQRRELPYIATLVDEIERALGLKNLSTQNTGRLNEALTTIQQPRRARCDSQMPSLIMVNIRAKRYGQRALQGDCLARETVVKDLLIWPIRPA